MFISCLRISPKAFKLIDDEFECCCVEDINFGSESASIGVAIVREYGKRGLDIGKNLACGVIWWAEFLKHDIISNGSIDIEWIINAQDGICPKYIDNWLEYANSRDEWLQKFEIWT